MIDEQIRREIERVVEEKIAPLKNERALEHLAAEIRETQVTHAEFERDMREGMSRLFQGLHDLAESQKLTDGSVKDLAAAQARTDGSVNELAAAQARTDKSVKELAAAQARTDGSVKELAAAQARTDGSVKELAAAQARTDESLRLLAESQRKGFESMRSMFGQTIEEIAAEIVPHYLEHEEGIEVETLQVEYFQVGAKTYEIDLCGDGRDREGGDVLVLCEAKTTADLRDVDHLADLARKIGEATGRRVHPVLFPARCPKRALVRAREAGVTLVPWRYQYRI